MSLQTVITSDQARQITGGRKPLVPVEYETAVKALAACLTIDDAKLWDAKADALAAWAKIYREDEVGLKAKALKLHAYRRMGLLASELRPHKTSNKGRGPGPKSLLLDSGMSKTQAESATALARMSDFKFRQVLKDPKAPITVTRLDGAASPIYTKFAHAAQNLRGITRMHSAAEMARVLKSLTSGESKTARALCADLIEWLDDLDARLKAFGVKL